MTFAIAGSVSVPGDKSLSHRALMLAAVAHGSSRLRGLLAGADCQSTAEILRALNVHIPEFHSNSGEITIPSKGIDAWAVPASVLDCGNSGTTARLMMGLLAGRPFCSNLAGDQSLSARPMRRITDPLGEMGASFTEHGEAGRLPIEICGGELKGIAYRSPKASAQIKSAIMLAGLSGKVPVSVWEPIRSRDHTERMLTALDCTIKEEDHEDGWLISLVQTGALPGLDMQIPGDPSSAAFLAALAVLAASGELRVTGVGLNPTRTGFFHAVRRMGGKVTFENEAIHGGELMGDVIAGASQLRGISLGREDVPAMIDELPIFACLATRADGETRITGAEELRAKESDRITAMVSNFRAIGADVEELDDGMVIQGSDKPLRGRIRAFDDHRIAMAFGVLAALPDTDITIDTPAVSDVSFPGFWELLEDVTDRAVRS